MMFKRKCQTPGQSKDKDGNPIKIDSKGNSFNPDGMILHSIWYKDRWIKYTTDYDNKPGMIYWEYTSKPEKEPAPCPVKKADDIWEAALNVSPVAVMGVLFALGLAVALIILTGGTAAPGFAALFCV